MVQRNSPNYPRKVVKENQNNYMNKNEWLSLDNQTRARLKKALGLIPTQNSEVVNDRIVSDGIAESQLQSIPQDVWDGLLGVQLQEPVEAVEREILTVTPEAITTFPVIKRRDVKPKKPKTK